MALGSEIFVRDLEMPASAELITPEDAVVVLIARPKSMAEPTEEDAEETAEVEVVGKGKRKEEGDGE